MLQRLFLCATIFLMAPLLASAQTSGVKPVTLPYSSIIERSSAGKTIVCGNLPPWTAGRTIGGTGFISTAAEITAFKKLLRKTRSVTTRSKIQRSIKKLNNYAAIATPICDQENDLEEGSGYFDAAGNLTNAGKAAFAVPLNLSANAGTGYNTWKTNCGSCHAGLPQALSANTFPAIKDRIQLSPMNFAVPGEITEQQIADIVALANF